MAVTSDINQEQLKLAISEIEDYAIILLDVDGTILNWNTGAKNIKGYSAKEIIGKNFRKFYTTQDRDEGKPDRLIQIAIEKGRANDEGWRVAKGGATFWGSVTITAVHDNHGNVTGFIKVTRNLTERREAELTRKRYIEKIEDKNKEVEQFVYVASHDLQEPLRTINSFTKLLADDYRQHLDEVGHQSVRFILQATERMSMLIKGLLDYGRIGRNRELVTVDCMKMVRDIERDLAIAIADENATIEVGKLPEVKAYETELRMLFQNLLSNAIKFHRKGVSPYVTISAKMMRGFWIFAVKDDGIGIPDEYKQRIFIIFQRLHANSEYGGTGIGLAHCQKIVDMHGGKLWFDSEPGKGSTFYFTIPG